MTNSKRLTYVAIGASDTVGIGAENPSKESWVAVIASRLPKGARFVRLGVNASTAAQAVQQQLRAAEKARPDLVTVWLATNDFDAQVPLDEYERALSEVLGRAGRGGQASVFVGNIPDLAGVPAYAGQSEEGLTARVEIWNRAIAKVAGQNDATLVDLYGPSKKIAHLDLPLVAADGFHPSTTGYRVIADLFWQSISTDPSLGPAVGGHEFPSLILQE